METVSPALLPSLYTRNDFLYLYLQTLTTELGALMNNALKYLTYAKYATLGALGGVSLLGSVLMLLSIPMAQSGLEGTAMVLGGIGGIIVAKVAHLV